jgi:hypothetical protein
VDKAVKDGIVQPGQYLLLHFDFSRVTRNLKRDGSMDGSVEFLGEEINDELSEFKREYDRHLGPSFALATSGFKEGDPAGNLRKLIRAVDRALRDIKSKDEKGHPLWDVQGVCLFYTTHTIIYSNT